MIGSIGFEWRGNELVDITCMIFLQKKIYAGTIN